MAPEFTDAQVRMLALAAMGYYSLLVLAPSVVVAHLFGLLGLPRLRLATPVLVAAVAAAFEHDAPMLYVPPTIATLLLLLGGRPRILFGTYGPRRRPTPGPVGDAPGPGSGPGGTRSPMRWRAAFASVVPRRAGAPVGSVPAMPWRVAFWVAVAAAHYGFVLGALRLSTAREHAAWASSTALAGLLGLLAAAAGIARSSSRAARSRGCPVAPAFFGSARAFLAITILGAPLASVPAYAILLTLVYHFGPHSEVGAAAAVVGAPLLAAPAAWVAGLALAPAGADRAYRGAGREAGAVWTGQWWAALGSLLGCAIALLDPLSGLLVVPAIVIALSGAGYLRAAAVRESRRAV